jgi:hypothetical protein
MRNVLGSLERVAAIALDAAAAHDRGPASGRGRAPDSGCVPVLAGRAKAAGDRDGLRRCFPDAASPSDGCMPGAPAADDGCFPGGAA